MSLTGPAPSERAEAIGAAVAAFVREVVVPYERDSRRDAHGPSDDLVIEMRAKARAAGVLTPHILADGEHLTQRETAYVLRQSGLSYPDIGRSLGIAHTTARTYYSLGRRHLEYLLEHPDDGGQAT